MSKTDQPLTSFREFVRVYPKSDGEVIQSVTIYPMYNFGVSMDVFRALTNEAVEKTNEVFDPENPERMLLLINHLFNASLSKLDAEGRLVIPEKQGIVSSRDCYHYYDGDSMSYTNDGFITFHFSHIPPSISNQMH